jgi:cell division protein FtsN
MARDYKNAGRKKTAANGAPPWLWMFGGLAIGLFVALLVYLDKRADGPTDIAELARAVTDKVETRTAAKANPGEKNAVPPQPRFDFYDRLQQMEVVIPEQEIRSGRPEHPEKEDDKTLYYLQAGSFRKFEDADRLKAGLALNGIESIIQRVTVNDSETWHRVRVGPFVSLREVSKVRNRMRESNIEPMMLKVNG